MRTPPKYPNSIKYAVIGEFKINPGLSIKSLADKHNCSYTSVGNWLRPAKGQRFAGRSVKFDDVVKVFNDAPGLTQVEIGLICNVSGTTVGRIISQYLTDRRNRKSTDERTI